MTITMHDARSQYSPKALGVASIFMGTLVSIGVLSNLITGRFDFRDGPHALQSTVAIVAGTAFLAIGMRLIQKASRGR